MFEKGEDIGTYQIIEQLGQGGMATVYKAYHSNLDRYVALKILHPALKETDGFLGRFEREARLIARLEHPNIVPVYDYADHRGNPYLVMRFIEGMTLKAYLNQGPLSMPRVVHIISSVAAGLQYAHEQGILHRDIKPSNIMLTNEGKVFITDFGLARMVQVGESTLSRDMIVGTPQYISPEQAKGEKVDITSDIYSFGVVIYQLLVGRVPFSADTPYAVVHDHIFTPLPMPRTLNPEVSEPLERFLLKTLSKKSGDRYETVSKMQEAFLYAVENDSDAIEYDSDASIILPRGDDGMPRTEQTMILPSDAITGTMPAPKAAVTAPSRKKGKQKKSKKQSSRKVRTATKKQKKKGSGLWKIIGFLLLLGLLIAAVVLGGEVLIEEYNKIFGSIILPNKDTIVQMWETLSSSI